MTASKRLGIFAIVWMVGIGLLEVGAYYSIPGVHGVATPAEARVGRPLTPVSVAGVGRRTVRRCAAGVYHC